MPRRGAAIPRTLAPLTVATIMLLDRSRRAGRHLEWKVRLFTLGAVLAVVGMALDRGWMIGAAIVVLGLGLTLRFLPGGREIMPDDDSDDQEDDRAGVAPRG
ncbi:MAG: hypothetical protein U5R14_09315 [Gemmatimonadota bacterium]|nr:hypothetical protein [Gemmatimonadota bacterium]